MELLSMSLPDEVTASELLVQRLAPHSKLLRCWPLSGGMSATMTAFELVDPAGQTSKRILRQPSSATLKRNPTAAADEFKLLQRMHAEGLATPTPYFLDSSGEIFSTPSLVIDYIEGKPEFTPRHITDFARQLARQLARIHQVDGTHPTLAFLPKLGAGFVENLDNRPAIVDKSLAEGQIRDRLEAVWPLPPRNRPVLLHGDFWPGNILWQDDQLVAVIDWEDAKVGDPLFDLAISRLDLRWIVGSEAMQTFTREYQSQMTLDYTNLPYWDLYAALRFVRLAGAQLADWAAFFAPYGRPDITEQTIRHYYHGFVDQAFQRIDRQSSGL
jgi:aminoglycoside phosphotransferase (APT) family kinase protein